MFDRQNNILKGDSLNINNRTLSRRELLGMTVGLGGMAISGIAQTAERMFTPPLALGPFYPQIKPLDRDADLTIIKGRKVHAEGKIIHVTGRVLNVKGKPVRNARMEIWQADSRGRYSHRSDPNKAILDTNFQGYCALKTDDQGRYRFKTIMPASYPGLIAGMRAPHIHFEVFGKNDRTVTQVFFPGEKLNDQDTILQGLRGDKPKSAVMMSVLPPTKDIGPNETLFGWDCVLLTG